MRGAFSSSPSKQHSHSFTFSPNTLLLSASPHLTHFNHHHHSRAGLISYPTLSSHVLLAHPIILLFFRQRIVVCCVGGSTRLVIGSPRANQTTKKSSTPSKSLQASRSLVLDLNRLSKPFYGIERGRFRVVRSARTHRPPFSLQLTTASAPSDRSRQH